VFRTRPKEEEALKDEQIKKLKQRRVGPSAGL
jgi:hypothetical protein